MYIVYSVVDIELESRLLMEGVDSNITKYFPSGWCIESRLASRQPNSANYLSQETQGTLHSAGHAYCTLIYKGRAPVMYRYCR